MKTAQINKFFNPKSIAVIGASRSKKKVGGIILNNILLEKYPARIYPVNPNANKIMDLDVFDTIMDVPEIVDVAIIAIPSMFIYEIIEECGIKGVKNIIIVSAGFSETGAEGLKLELRIRVLAQKYQLNILGPNCLGIINARNNLNLSFANTPKSYSNGKISFLSQSGAIGTAFMDWAQSNNIEISKFVSLGNKSDLSEIDFLKYLEQDNDTEIILLYLESFTDGRKFYELAKSISHKKPIVVLKPGKTEATQKAMEAHTGSIATSDKIIEQALEASGCIRVNSIEELFNITKLLAWQPILKGNNVTIITNAGGVAIETIDQLQANGLEVSPLPKSLQLSLSKLLKESASTHNPIDLLGDALARDYKNAIEQVVKSNSTDAILILLTPQLMTESLKTAKFVNEIADKHHKVVLASFLGGEKVHIAQAFLTKEKLPHFNFANDAAGVLGKIWKWRSHLETSPNSRLHYPTIINPTLKVTNKGEMLPENETKKLLDKYNIKYLKSDIFNGVKDLGKNISKIKYPIVLKLSHPQLIHKTDIKAVRLPIYQRSDLIKASIELDEIAQSQSLIDYKLEVQPFIFEKLELILGINRDKDQIIDSEGRKFSISKGFGHSMIVGAGGIYTEVLDDSSLRLLPVNRNNAMEMLKEIKYGQILFGARRQHFDYQALLKMMLNLSKMIEKNYNIRSLDINPVFVTQNDAYAVDIKIFID
ncbi:acetate--CoA ligase family protein [Candidatus Dojkabacteria bacterium]|uniref:Acetate--CoA ligase family protein n=1 Tax=Candidatus Dojkabacteria bacterium TaxID=2099670 RepID=A0A955I7E9_9BACT|nr:acetate--CoA ligase family protein [Candidatus Dojkabacteria bacterium]